MRLKLPQDRSSLISQHLGCCSQRRAVFNMILQFFRLLPLLILLSHLPLSYLDLLQYVFPELELLLVSYILVRDHCLVSVLGTEVSPDVRLAICVFSLLSLTSLFDLMQNSPFVLLHRHRPHCLDILIKHLSISKLILLSAPLLHSSS